MVDISEDESLNRLVAQVAQILHLAGVPNVLWGNYLLTIYGVPTIVDDVAYVVPDEHLTTASSALEEAEFSPCRKGPSCIQMLYRFQARPALEHFHIRDNFVISLYQKSDALWELDALQSSQLTSFSDIQSAAEPPLPLAAPGCGRGRLSPECSIVRIPTAARFCEALILLLCRDYKTDYESYWMALLTYMFEYVAETDVLTGKDLREEFREFYYAMRQDEIPVIFSLLDRIRDDLSSSGRLQPISVNK